MPFTNLPCIKSAEFNIELEVDTILPYQVDTILSTDYCFGTWTYDIGPLNITGYRTYLYTPGNDFSYYNYGDVDAPAFSGFQSHYLSGYSQALFSTFAPGDNTLFVTPQSLGQGEQIGAAPIQHDYFFFGTLPGANQQFSGGSLLIQSLDGGFSATPFQVIGTDDCYVLNYQMDDTVTFYKSFQKENSEDFLDVFQTNYGWIPNGGGYNYFYQGSDNIPHLITFDLVPDTDPYSYTKYTLDFSDSVDISYMYYANGANLFARSSDGLTCYLIAFDGTSYVQYNMTYDDTIIFSAYILFDEGGFPYFWGNTDNGLVTLKIKEPAPFLNLMKAQNPQPIKLQCISACVPLIKQK